MQVTIYSTTTCAFCHVLTTWLQKENIVYTKKNTDVDDAAMIEFMQVNEGNIGVPFTVITDNEGITTKIVGFDQAKFKQVLGL
jgi:glutaredoxin 3